MDKKQKDLSINYIIDQGLVEMKGHKNKPIRKIILIAAAAVLMTATVLAAVTGFGGMWVVNDHDVLTKSDEISSYPISNKAREFINTNKGTEWVVIDVDGKEDVVEKGKENGRLVLKESFIRHDRSFESLDEASIFFGVPLLGLPDSESSVECNIFPSEETGHFVQLRYYSIDDTVSCCISFIISDKNIKDYVFSPTARNFNSPGYLGVSDAVSYESKNNGIDALITLTTFYNDDSLIEFERYTAEFVHNNISYAVGCLDNDANDIDKLKEVIDSLE